MIKHTFEIDIFISIIVMYSDNLTYIMEQHYELLHGENYFTQQNILTSRAD